METIRKWTGEEFEMEEEFDALDKDKTGQILFEDMVKWALKKNMQVELRKQEEKEKGKEKVAETAEEKEE